MTVSTGFRSVQESISSWVSSFTSVSRAPLLDTSRRCLCRNQLFQPFLVFARRREVTFLCREQKRKQLGREASPLLGPPLWNNLPDDLRDPSLSLTVFKQRLKSYLFKQCWCTIQPKLTFAATFQLMHLHSSVRSFASKEVTFTLHYITSRHHSWNHLPHITLANVSFIQATFPYKSKLALVSLLLQKPGLPKSYLINFRPIFHLNAIDKILERLALARFLPHFSKSPSFSPLQSCFHFFHILDDSSLL